MVMFMFICVCMFIHMWRSKAGVRCLPRSLSISLTEVRLLPSLGLPDSASFLLSAGIIGGPLCPQLCGSTSELNSSPDPHDRYSPTERSPRLSSFPDVFHAVCLSHFFSFVPFFPASTTSPFLSEI